LLYPALVAEHLGAEPGTVDESSSYLVPIVGDWSVNPPFPALLARDSVTDAEHGNDGLFPLAGKWKIVIANGTAIFMTHRAQYETTRDVFRRNNCRVDLMFVGGLMSLLFGSGLRHARSPF
jgi:hypothetical protein